MRVPLIRKGDVKDRERNTTLLERMLCSLECTRTTNVMELVESSTWRNPLVTWEYGKMANVVVKIIVKMQTSFAASIQMGLTSLLVVITALQRREMERIPVAYFVDL